MFPNGNSALYDCAELCKALKDKVKVSQDELKRPVFERKEAEVKKLSGKSLPSMPTS